MSETLRDLLILALITIISTILIWLPFILDAESFWGLSYPGGGMEVIWRNFDGLNYIAVAKSFYNPQILTNQFSALGLSPIYFASHFPLYPIFIALAFFVFGNLYGMLAVTVIFTTLSAMMFYLLVKDFNLTTNPLFLSIVFLFFPARWVVVRSVGSNEPLFIFLILFAFYAIRKSWWFVVAATSSLAVLTRSPAAILFAALILSLVKKWTSGLAKPVLKKFPLQGFYLMLAPLTALGLFYFYQIQYGDFLAYFHSGDNIHLTLPIWPIFNSNQYWVGTFWLENIIYVYLFLGAATVILWRKKIYDLSIFVGLYFIAGSFVAHLDIGRYTIPAFPFVLIAFENFINTREFKIVFLILLIPIYLFTQNFLLGNISPVADFAPFR